MSQARTLSEPIDPGGKTKSQTLRTTKARHGSIRQAPSMKFIESIVLSRRRQENEAQWDDRDEVFRGLVLPRCRDTASMYRSTERVVGIAVTVCSRHQHTTYDSVSKRFPRNPQFRAGLRQYAKRSSQHLFFGPPSYKKATMKASYRV